ncbi:MAG: flagellar motor switch protein FliN [Candidatus Competibacteraceae bacterium]|nr:flagellar motor switch protein FliN [Candidatus Competibacteraceae bacterium]
MSRSPRDIRGEAQDHAFDEELRPVHPGAMHLDMQALKQVRLAVAADLGQCKLLVREVLELKRGSVLPLNKLAGELADLHINGIPFAKGEIVVLGDTLHVRIAEIFGTDSAMQDSADG